MASNLFTYNKNLLSAAKYSSPVSPALTALSGFGVGIVSLSTNDVGIAFRQRTTTPLTNQFATVTVLGSVFNVDWAFDGSHMALITRTGYNNFQFLSASATVPSVTATREVSTAETQRKRQLGYF